MSDIDDDLVDGVSISENLEEMETIPVTMIAEKPYLVSLSEHMKNHNKSIEVTCFDHANVKEDILETTSIIILEFRILKSMDDLALISSIRGKRSLVPIIVICDNEDSEFILMTMTEGANDYLSSTISHEILAEKVNSFHKLAKASRLIEF